MDSCSTGGVGRVDSRSLVGVGRVDSRFHGNDGGGEDGHSCSLVGVGRVDSRFHGHDGGGGGRAFLLHGRGQTRGFPAFPPHPVIPAAPRHAPLVIPVKTGIHAIAPVIPATPRPSPSHPVTPPCHSRENGNPRDCPRHSPPHPAISAKTGTTGGRARSPAGGAGVCWGDWPEGLGPAANTGKTVHDYG